jgi:outer membrane protein assembly factor BamA
LDQLIGSRIGVFNVELRFPLTRSVALGFLPVSLPPIEGAVFYDVGLAWENGSTIVGRRSDGEDPEVYRAPLQSWGGSIRVNFLGIPLRFDYARPLNRTFNNGYWTISVGPTF